MPEGAGPVRGYLEAIGTVLAGLQKSLDARKCVWCDYAVVRDLAGFQDKADKKVEKAFMDDELSDYPCPYWLVGLPSLKVVTKDIPRLSVSTDLYLVASTNRRSCWWPIPAKADSFEFPIALLDSLPQSLMKGELEAGGAHVVEAGEGEKVYEFMGRQWRVPDAFLGFLWALAERKMGLEGLLDPAALQVLKKAKATPQSGVQGLTSPAQAGGDKDGDDLTVQAALKNLGMSGKDAEQALAQAHFPPGASLEEKMKAVLQSLNK